MAGFDHFELLAPFYDRVIRFQDSDKLISLIGLPTQGIILDAGGGTGRVAQALVGQAGQIVVADSSLGMLRQAIQKKSLFAVNSQTESLPFPTESFDRIIMVDALHHVRDHPSTAGELWRVLKQGGRLVIEEPDIRLPVIKVVAILEKLALMRSHFLSPTKITKLFPYSDAQVRVDQEGYTGWVVVEKARNRNYA